MWSKAQHPRGSPLRPALPFTAFSFVLPSSVYNVGGRDSCLLSSPCYCGWLVTSFWAIACKTKPVREIQKSFLVGTPGLPPPMALCPPATLPGCKRVWCLEVPWPHYAHGHYRAHWWACGKRERGHRSLMMPLTSRVLQTPNLFKFLELRLSVICCIIKILSLTDDKWKKKRLNGEPQKENSL